MEKHYRVHDPSGHKGAPRWQKISEEDAVTIDIPDKKWSVFGEMKWPE